MRALRVRHGEHRVHEAWGGGAHTTTRYIVVRRSHSRVSLPSVSAICSALRGGIAHMSGPHMFMLHVSLAMPMRRMCVLHGAHAGMDHGTVNSK